MNKNLIMIIGLIVMTIIPAILVGQSIRVLTPEGDTVTITNENNPLASKYNTPNYNNDYNSDLEKLKKDEEGIEEIENQIKKNYEGQIKANEEMIKLNKDKMKINKEMIKNYDEQIKINEEMIKNYDEQIKINEKMISNKGTSSFISLFFWIFLICCVRLFLLI